MIKFLFNKNYFVSLTVVAVLCGILVACLEAPMKEDGVMALEDAFFIVREGFLVDMETKEYHASVVNCTLNLVLFIPLISQIFSSDLEIAKSYIFARMKNTSKWFSCKVIQSLFFCFFSTAVYNVTLLLTARAMGHKAYDWTAVFKNVFLGVSAGTLILFFLVMLSNVLSLVIKPYLAACAVTLGMAALIVTSCFLSGPIIQYVILIHYYVTWHMAGNINESLYSYPTWSYYLVIVMAVAAEIIAGNQLLKKRDQI